MGKSRMFDCLYLIVEITSCYYRDSFTYDIYRLMMDRVDPESFAYIELPQERIIFFYTDRIDFFISAFGLEMIGTFLYILFESPSAIDIEKLHPFTYSEYRFFRFGYFFHRVHEISIIGGDRISCSLHISTIEGWIDIRSSWKYESITHLYIDICMGRKTGDDDGYISCLFDLGDIVKGEIIEESSCIFSSLSKNTDFFHDLFVRVGVSYKSLL